MITSDEILTKLRKGESIEKIGNSIASVLNLANEQYQKEKEQEMRNAKRQTELAAIFASLDTWYQTYYGETFDGSNDELAKSVIELIDSAKDLNNLFGDFNCLFDSLPVKDQKNKKEKAQIQNNINKDSNKEDIESLKDLVKTFLA